MRVPLLFIVAALAISRIACASQDDPDQLPPAERALAQRTLAFIERMDSYYFNRTAGLNGNAAVEARSVTTEPADFQVKVARGAVVEKAGRMLSITRRPSKRFPKERLFNRFLSFDTHPRTPLVGTLHAALSVSFNKDGSSSVSGWVDVMPGAMRQVDLDTLRAALDEVYAKHGRDARKYRQVSCTGDPRFANKYRRRPACVGGSFYGEPLMPVTAANMDFVTESFEAFVSTYFDLIERRRDEPYTEEDVARQDAMRRNWFEDRLYADPDTTSITPYEVWSLSTLPPVVKF